MSQSEIGLIGLAVMGQNLARNIARKHKISVYNRTGSVTEQFIRQYGDENLSGFQELAEFVQSLQKPRKIGVMVKAGAPVDKVIDGLLPLLDKDDVIIDFGNSNFRDTIRREQMLSQQEIHFFGCGVSGGEEGALNGPSLMPGGNQAVFNNLLPVFKDIAARDFSGQPCVSHIGENGAGHFVKMVHNGIEYGVMQMMAEAYALLSRGFQLPADAIADIFEQFQQGRLRSYLFEIAVPILRKKDPLGEGFLLDQIVDSAGQKGTGRWTAIESLQLGTPLSVIAESVFARINSSLKPLRADLQALYPVPAKPALSSWQNIVPKLEQALFSGIIISYAQGFQMFEAAEQEHGWQLDFAEIARIWQGGCIIRADLLNILEQAFRSDSNRNLLRIPAIIDLLGETVPGLREITALGIAQAVPLFSLGAALASFDSITQRQSSANFIQALRDCFGAHTFKRLDREGVFHAQWSEDGKLYEK